jgi:integrase
MPVYPKGEGRWLVVVFHKGTRKDQIVHGSKTDAKDAEARLRLKLEAGNPIERRVAPKLSEFCLADYAHHAKAHLKKDTWSVRRYQIATLISHLGDKRLTEIGPIDIERYKQDRRKPDEKGKRPRNVTINNELAVYGAIRTYAKHLKYPVQEFRLVVLPVRNKRRMIVWNEEQVLKLYAEMKKLSPHLLAVVVFLANTGCREDEALALEPENVDFERKVVRIWASEPEHAQDDDTVDAVLTDEDDEWTTKSARNREVPIGDALLPVLQEQVEAAKENDCKFVFPTLAWGRYAVWPHNQFDRARKAAGLRGGPHTLRHTYASHFLRNKPDLYLLAQILGHSHGRVTELYAHLLPDHLAGGRNAVSFAAQ